MVGGDGEGVDVEGELDVAQEVGGEEHGAVGEGDDGEGAVAVEVGDFGAEFGDAAGDVVGGEEELWLLFGGHHGRLCSQGTLVWQSPQPRERSIQP